MKKIHHAWIASWAIIYGAVPKAENQFTNETLSGEEMAELFDSFCPACKSHSPEQVRKICARMIKLILQPVNTSAA